MSVKESSLRNLKPNKSHWNHSETITIRVPKVLRNKILKIAKKLDKNESVNIKNNSTVSHELNSIIDKIKNKEKGYKNNSASKLIKDLLEIVKD